MPKCYSLRCVNRQNEFHGADYREIPLLEREFNIGLITVLVIRLIVIFSFGFSQTKEKDRPEYCRHIFQYNSMKIVPRTRDIYNTTAMQSACYNISSCIFCKPVIF